MAQSYNYVEPRQQSERRLPDPPVGGVMGWLKKKLFGGESPVDALTHEQVASGPWMDKLPRFLPYFDEQTGETPTMRKWYRKMWADPNVKAACAGKIINVAALDPQFLPFDEDDPDAIEHADFLEWTVTKRLHNGMHGLAWDLLAHACTDGYAILEKCWKPQEDGQYKGKIGLVDLQPKQVDDEVVLQTDPMQRVVSIKGLQFNAGLEFDPRHFVIFQHMPMYGSPTGMSDFRAVYARYWMLDTVLKLRASGIEKRALPMLVGKYGNPSQKPTLDAALRGAKSSNWLTAPLECQVEAVNIAMSGDQIFKDAVLDLKHDIFLGIKFASLPNVEGQQGDRRGNSQVQKDESELLVWWLAKCIESVFNNMDDGLTRDIIGLNYYTEEYPTVVLGATDINELKIEMELWNTAQQMGAKISKRKFHQHFRIPTTDDPEDELQRASPGGGMGMPGQPGGGDDEWAKDAGLSVSDNGNGDGLDDGGGGSFFESFADERPVSEKPWTDTPQSSWVSAFRYSAPETKLQIEFKDNAICEYSDIEPRLAHNLRRVQSKGKWVWREVYDWPYELIQDAYKHSKVKLKSKSKTKPRVMQSAARKHSENGNGHIDTFAADDWTHQQGKHGGSLWVNRVSGKMVYGRDNPGGSDNRRRTDLEDDRAKQRGEHEKAKAEKQRLRHPEQLDAKKPEGGETKEKGGAQPISELAKSIEPQDRKKWPQIKKMATGAAVGLAAQVVHLGVSGELVEKSAEVVREMLMDTLNNISPDLLSAHGLLSTPMVINIASFALSHAVSAAKGAMGFAEDDRKAETVGVLLKGLWKPLGLSDIPMPTPEQIATRIDTKGGKSKPATTHEEFAESKTPFTGTITDSLGREYHYVNGVRTKHPEDAEPSHLGHADQHARAVGSGKPDVQYKQNGDGSTTARIVTPSGQVFVHSNKSVRELDKVVKDRYGGENTQWPADSSSALSKAKHGTKEPAPKPWHVLEHGQAAKALYDQSHDVRIPHSDFEAMSKRLADLKRNELVKVAGEMELAGAHKWSKAKLLDSIMRKMLDRRSGSQRAKMIMDATGETDDRELPEDHESYFNLAADTRVVPLDKLKSSRARPQGIENAAKFMAGAAAGTNAKRDPIKVVNNGDGTYTVADGNSTFANAKANDWKTIPIREVSREWMEQERQRSIAKEDARANNALASGRLFTTEEIEAHEPAHPYNDQKRVMESAKDTQPAFQAVLDLGKGLSQRLGANVLQHFTPEQFDAEMEKPGISIIIADIKSEDRAAKKAAVRGWSMVNDMVRATVAVDNVQQMEKAVKALHEELKERGWKVVEVKNRYENLRPDGYRDLNLRVRAPNGHVAEVQVNTKPMVVAKNKTNHPLYEQAQGIERKAKLEKRDLTPEEVKQVAEIDARQKAVYDAAWHKSLGIG